MKKRMINCLKRLPATISLTIVLLLCSVAVLAQTVVTGKVTESKNASPLPGVTVTVKGTKTSAQTTSDGSYKITAPANAGVLVFSSVGFTNQEVTITGATANVVMAESSQQLIDVVVVAYGTRKKTDLTGAVSQVSAKDFQKGNNNSAEQLLQGKVAGLQVTSGGGSAVCRLDVSSRLSKRHRRHEVQGGGSVEYTSSRRQSRGRGLLPQRPLLLEQAHA